MVVFEQNPWSTLPTEEGLISDFSVCLEVPNLVFSDPKRSTHGLQRSTSHLRRHAILSACVYVHSFRESLRLSLDVQRI